MKWWLLVGHTATRFRRGQGEQTFSPSVSARTPVGETVAQVAFSLLMQKPSASIGPLQICRHKLLWKRIVSKTVDYQNNKTRMHAASSGSATIAFSVPPFTLRGLYKQLNDVLNESPAGTVYSLKDYLGLAVKEVLLDGLDKGDLDTIRLELATLLDLSHPGVLKHHQVVEDDDFIYVVTDRHDKTLECLLTEHKRRKIPVPIAVILSVLRQVAAALAYLYGLSGIGTRGLVHRDLRPANIFISADGEYFVIAGLGLCRNALRGGSITAITRPYMAPEVLLHNETSPASDVWSLGVIVYELTILRRPDFLEGKDPKDVFVDGWRPNLSGVTDGFIKSILERIFVLEPERRPTARELHETLATAEIPVSELGHRCVALEDKCSALEAALNSANANIVLLKDELKVESDKVTALEAALDARSAEIASLKGALENRPSEADALGQEPRLKTTRIDALEDQCKEYLAMIKALEDKLAQSSSGMNTSSPQINLSALPQLIYAAHTNDMETVQMLANEKDCIGQRDERGMTALMHAAQQGHIGPVKLLVEKEKGLKDKNGWTALMHAAHGNHPEVARILIPHEHGRKSKNGRTALMIAAQEGHAEAASVLAPYEEDLTDRQGNTALILAAEAGHEAVVEALDPTDDRGVTALMRAAKRNDTLAVSALIPVQKKRLAPTGTALIQAAICGHVAAVRLLMPYESRARDGCGATALMKAASENHAEVVQLLMEREGCMLDPHGLPAIVHAAYGGRLEIVKLLFEKEGHLIDKSNESFFDKLEAKGYSEIASFLRDSRTPGADDCNDHQAAPRAHE
ncbi:Kinase, NEK [Giardia duodenalis]|uniref:Kinase, NEK n=1 Tax=Giardia intestinalis (strain ATCC 50803 / WB clone C6) TaxID=184922 RepID=A8BWR9_GIAIC|nr:Kinase, NEK [Giardia intestinalis]KAE8301251.1 Kinase, NEK [Giardia intestinalis]|eukprot:XP_001704387.1 Kinase, NEK [Giardia lamblia ATCC 50803]